MPSKMLISAKYPHPRLLYQLFLETTSGNRLQWLTLSNHQGNKLVFKFPGLKTGKQGCEIQEL